jgi:hypothetical protein
MAAPAAVVEALCCEAAPYFLLSLMAGLASGETRTKRQLYNEGNIW